MNEFMNENEVIGEVRAPSSNSEKGTIFIFLITQCCCIRF